MRFNFQVSVVVKIIINKNPSEEEFILHSGSDTPIIIILVFASLGGVLLILLLFIIVTKNRRRRPCQEDTASNHHRQSPLPRAHIFSGDNIGHEEDDWSSVDLNSPRHNSSNNFFNRGFTVRQHGDDKHFKIKVYI